MSCGFAANGEGWAGLPKFELRNRGLINRDIFQFSKLKWIFSLNHRPYTFYLKPFAKF